MFTLPLKPLSGRLAFRQVADGYCAMVGILELPKSLTVRENAGYVMQVSKAGLWLFPETLDEGVPANTESYGIEHQLRAQIWPTLVNPSSLFLVRFIEAFSKQNMWTVYAALRQEPSALGAPKNGHWWRDVVDGELQALEQPEEIRTGATVSQLLTQMCVWPGPKGELYTLPQHPVKLRETYQTLSIFHAMLGAEKLTEKAYWEIVRASPSLSSIAPLSVDMGYCRYLAQLAKFGDATEVDRPRNAQENKLRETLSKDALRASLKAA